mgnify:CR=1 FL=1
MPACDIGLKQRRQVAVLVELKARFDEKQMQLEVALPEDMIVQADPSLLQIVREQNSQALTQVPGVGASTAKKIIPYLADKFKKWSDESEGDAICSLHVPIWEEAEEILLSLGLTPREIAETHSQLQKEKDSEWSSAEQIVKEVLKRRKHSS